MKTETLSLLCACVFLSFSPLHATSVEDELLKGIYPYHRTEVTGYMNDLGDDMKQAILNADFTPRLRHQVIKSAHNITPERIPLLRRALAPFSSEIIFHDRVEKATRLPDTYLQALADAPLSESLLRYILSQVDFVTPNHIAPMAAFCDGMDRLYLAETVGPQFSKIVAKTPDEIAAVAALGLDPGYRMAVLQDMSLFNAEKRPALRRLLEGQVYSHGLKTLQAALPHDARTLTRYADEGFEPDHRATLLGTNILDLPPEHLALAKSFMGGMRISSHFEYAARKVISASPNDLVRVINGDFQPHDRCSVLLFIQELTPDQLPPLKSLLESKSLEIPYFPFQADQIVQGVARRHHTLITMDALCDPFFTRTSVAIILAHDKQNVDQKIHLIKELQLQRKQVEDFHMDIDTKFKMRLGVEQLQKMLDCARVIVETPLEPYQKAAFFYVSADLEPAQIVPIAALLKDVPHYFCYETREFIWRTAKLSNERLEHIARAGFHPAHIDSIMQHLEDIDPAHYPWVKEQLSKVSVVYQGPHSSHIHRAVRKIKERLAAGAALPME